MKIEQTIKKIFQKLLQNLYLFLILLLLLDIIFGGALFLKYYLEQEKMPPTPSSLKIDQNLLDKASAIFRNKEISSMLIDENQYPDPFHN